MSAVPAEAAACPFILVATADEKLQELVADDVEAEGFAPIVARNGHQAMEEAQHGLALLILDMSLGGTMQPDTLAVALRTLVGRSVCILALQSGQEAPSQFDIPGVTARLDIIKSPDQLRQAIRQATAMCAVA
jgi:CheY-like chemotaxis protein